jgi:hypothetical protein
VCESAQGFQSVDETGRIRVRRGGDDDASSAGKCAVGNKTIKLFPRLTGESLASFGGADTRSSRLHGRAGVVAHAGQAAGTMPVDDNAGATVRMTPPQRSTAN